MFNQVVVGGDGHAKLIPTGDHHVKSRIDINRGEIRHFHVLRNWLARTDDHVVAQGSRGNEHARGQNKHGTPLHVKPPKMESSADWSWPRGYASTFAGCARGGRRPSWYKKRTCDCTIPHMLRRLYVTPNSF